MERASELCGCNLEESSNVPFTKHYWPLLQRLSLLLAPLRLRHLNRKIVRPPACQPLVPIARTTTSLTSAGSV